MATPEHDIAAKRLPKTARNYRAAPLAIAVYFAAVVAVFVSLTGNWVEGAFFSYVGMSVAIGMLLVARAKRKRQRFGRLLALHLVGLVLFAGAGVAGRINFQLEGFFFFAFAGLAIGTVVHYLIAKIIGPLVIGRVWCGWGCWTAMVLDLLPFKRSPGRIARAWEWVRYAHFVASAALVAILFFAMHYTIFRRNWDIRGMWWFLAGNGLYFALALALAFALKDNRAFCKYLCPVVAFLKPAAAPALLKIASNASACRDCGACATLCPMDIAVNDYARQGQRVRSSECILCMTCVKGCPQGALSASVGFDLCGRSKVRLRPGRAPTTSPGNSTPA